jgi:AcrR family transcriptional regulator
MVLSRSAATREQILDAGANLFAGRAGVSVEAVIQAARVSRATFYRHFRSRAELLSALDVEPDPGSRERILAAAAELIGRDGLRAMSMDELAARAGVSRASVYRLFPGKAALFDALLAEHSPFEQVTEVLERMADRPPAEVFPAIARTAASIAAPRIGILRSLMYEVTSQSPDALAGADPRIRQLLASVGGYMASQMAAGRLRRMHPMLAAQLLIGPLVFHLVSRAGVERLAALDIPIDAVVEELAQAALRAVGATPSAET